MGNVLVKWVPETFMKGYSETEKELLGNERYYSENWLRLDRGELSEDELTELVCSRIPEKYHADDDEQDVYDQHIDRLRRKWQYIREYYRHTADAAGGKAVRRLEEIDADGKQNYSEM